MLMLHNIKKKNNINLLLRVGAFLELLLLRDRTADTCIGQSIAFIFFFDFVALDGPAFLTLEQHTVGPRFTGLVIFLNFLALYLLFATAANPFRPDVTHFRFVLIML